MLALEQVSEEPDIADFAATAADVELLWDVCQIPDYRNISNAEHAGIVGRIFRFLRSGDGLIPTDWFARQLSYCDRFDGDIDTISNRISHIRTWTFVANRTWLVDPAHWQGRARQIEDKLSDALHESLTQRFIDRRTSVLMKRMQQREDLASTVEQDGAIHVEGEFVGHMKGLLFVPAQTAGEAHERTLRAASAKAVAQEMDARAHAISASPDPDLALSRDGHVIWQSSSIARLEAGSEILKPRIDLLAGSELAGANRDAVQLRLERWLGRHIAGLAEPLVRLSEDESITGLARGVAFRLIEQLGVISRDVIADDVKALGQEDRATLRKHGVRFGAFHIFIPALLKPAATQLRLLLWGLSLEKSGALARSAIPEPPGQGLTSLAFDPATPNGFYRIAGFRVCGRRCVRIDMLERLGDLIRNRVFWRPRVPGEARPAGSIEGGGFSVVADMMSLVGCSGEEFAEILRSLGFRMERRARPASPAVVGPVTGTAAASGASDMACGPLPEPPSAPDASLERGFPATEGQAGEIKPGAGLTHSDGSLVSLPPALVSREHRGDLEIWWPRDTGPFRPRQHKPRRKPRTTKSKAARPPPSDISAERRPPSSRLSEGRKNQWSGRQSLIPPRHLPCWVVSERDCPRPRNNA